MPTVPTTSAMADRTATNGVRIRWIDPLVPSIRVRDGRSDRKASRPLIVAPSAKGHRVEVKREPTVVGAAGFRC